MGFKSLALTAACAIILSVAAAPTENRISGPYGYSFDEVTEANRMYDNILAAQTGCEGQSCIIADLAGSTGRKIKERPEGGGKKDFSCIGKYNPKGMEDVMKVPNVQKQPTGLSSSLLGGMNSIQGYFPSKVDTGTFKGACKPNILFFARGTTEPELTSALGITVGPKLNSGLGGVMGSRDWLIQGIFYGADVPGDYCLGLAGGMVAKDLINQAAQKCPDAKIFVSGYSQGAMVAHNGVAYAEPLAKKRVAGVITFGDPFQGAPIKGYKGPIVTFCNTGDGVCTGNFEVGAKHLAYTGNPSAQAIAKIKQIAKDPLWSAASADTGGDDDASKAATKKTKKKASKSKSRPKPEAAATEDEPE